MTASGSKRNIYIVQFETGTNINLLPLAAGQLYSRLNQEKNFLRKNGLELKEIVFQRPDDPKEFVSGIEDVFIIGFASFLWNVNITLKVACEVSKRFKKALIVLGGPSVPKDEGLADRFLEDNPYIDAICLGEGEDVFWEICREYARGNGLDGIKGLIFRDRKTAKIFRNNEQRLVCMDTVVSPYLDGTFDDFFKKYRSSFSGIVLETNRGCPYECAFCTWGNQPARKIRYKSMDRIREEIEWAGKNKVGYIAMADSNFGISDRDIGITRMFAEIKAKYGVPNFISVSWAKNSADRILEIVGILQKADIGFRVTLSLQSLNQDALKAINRQNIKAAAFYEIKEAYRKKKAYSYTELILGLPLETYESFLAGVETSLSDSVFDQLYVYPLFLFPNTKLSSVESREKFKIESKIIENRYTKSKEQTKVKEYVEILVGHSTMPKEKWRDAFVVGYFMLALHDDRLAFFILNYLKKEFGVKISDLVIFARTISGEGDFPDVRRFFKLLETCAQNVQVQGHSHLIEPRGFDGVPFDPPNAAFLELLMERDRFYSEIQQIVSQYLDEHAIRMDKVILKDLIDFQKAIMAHPDGLVAEDLSLKYDWVDYFAYTFHLAEKPLNVLRRKLRIVDPHPCYGSRKAFLKSHYDIRGVPVFNEIYDEKGKLVFPILNEHPDKN